MAWQRMAAYGGEMCTDLDDTSLEAQSGEMEDSHSGLHCSTPGASMQCPTIDDVPKTLFLNAI